MKDNLLYADNKEIPCGRCKSNDSELVCTNCDPQFKYACINCDNIIHSLPSKKNHKRVSVNSLEPPLTSKYERGSLTPVENNSELSSSNKFNIMQSLSPIRPNQFQSNNVTPNNQNNIDFNSNNQRNTGNNMNSLNNQGNTEYQDNFNEMNQNNYSMNNNIINTNTLNNETKNTNKSHFYVSDSYSKEYVNEIRAVHEKEKSELNYKYLTLQNNFDRMKNSLLEQISNLQSQLEDTCKKNNLSIKYLQEEHSLLLQKEKNEKELEIKKLIENMESLEKANDELFTRVEENYRSMQDYKKSFHYKLKDMNEIIEKKEHEIVNTKLHYEKILNDLSLNFEDENKKLVNNYEEKIKRLNDKIEECNERYQKLKVEKDKEFKSEVEVTVKELEKADITIFELKKEVEYHKQNLLTYRNKRQEMEKDMEILMNNIEKYKKESNFQITEIKMIDNENKNLLKENEELKLKVTQMERFIMGKKVNRLT